MKKEIRYCLLVILSGLCFSVARAQDHVYSQFFKAPMYLNPSLTGQFEGDLRINMIYRNQWTGLSTDLSYLTASADLHVPKFGGGFGLMFTRSSEGSAQFVKNNIAGTYAYSVGDNDFVASFGILAGLSNLRVDWDHLVFADQIDMRSGIIPGSSSSAEIAGEYEKYYFDAAAGMNIVYRNFMLGAAAYHLNKPDEALTGSQAKLPMRLTAHLSWRAPLGRIYTFQEEALYFIPSLVYNRHAKFSAISLGGELKHRKVRGGVWYRSAGRSEPEAVVVSFTFDIFKGRQKSEKITIGASHDATLSRINYTNTSGCTEVAVGFEKYFNNSNSYSKFNSLRCYDFY